MASITTDPSGSKRIQVVISGGKRVSIRVGKTSKRDAESFRVHIENLVGWKFFGLSLPDETAAWLNGRGTFLRSKLEKTGIVDPIGQKSNKTIIRLGDFIHGYIDKRKDIKPGTRTCLNLVKGRMIRFFGEDRDIESITEQDAEDFKQSLIGKEKLAENTARRSVSIARQFFRAAVKGRLLEANPFDGIPVSLKEVRDRHIFLNHDDSMKVLESCPDSQWRLIFALCRWGGLRCPSEVLSLKWEHIDWERNRIRVVSPKTERHDGHDSRVIPLFPELLKPLQEVYDQATEGTEWVITRYRLDNSNLRTQFQRILVNAGIKPWPKPFQNLRSTRETELMERFPIHVVCAWIGNSVLIAKKSYLQIRDEDYDKACTRIAQSVHSQDQSVQNPAQNIPEQTSTNMTALRELISQVFTDSGLIRDPPKPSKMDQICRNRGERIRTFGLLDPNQAL